MTKFSKTTGSEPRRPSSRRSLANRILVVCGGEKTEKAYLDGLKSHARNPAVKVTVKSGSDAPLALVEIAAEIRRRDEDQFDEVWAVFDVDDFEISRAIIAASAKGIRVAVSNPCFELWLLLHFQPQNGHLPNYKAVRDKLKRHLPTYDKSKPDFRHFKDGVGDAYERAAKLPDCCDDPGANPSTGVWRLVGQIHPEICRPPQ